MPEEKVTYCRICEPLCGMVATVEDGRLIQLRPDKDHPLSKGFACPKGIAFTEIHNDPDRVLHPLKQNADGEFERVSWDSAMTDIIGRLRGVHARHGADGIGWYFGNPSVFSIAHTALDADVPQRARHAHVFSRRLAGRQQPLRRQPAALRHADLRADPRPRPRRFLLVIGANPLVSHGTVLTAPRIKEQLHGDRRARRARGRRRPAADRDREGVRVAADHARRRRLPAALAAARPLRGGPRRQSAIASQADGATGCARWPRLHSPEATEQHTGIPAETVRELAATLAQTERAAIYGRTGTCLGRSGTLTTFLLDAVNLVAGNLDREGGAMFGDARDPRRAPAPATAPREPPIRYGATPLAHRRLPVGARHRAGDA